MPRRDSVSSDIPEQDLVETLYSHPNVKIISFTATGRAFARSPAPSNVDPPGTLSWSSQLERTIAVGKYLVLDRFVAIAKNPTRAVSHLPSPAIRSFLELRFCSTAYLTKKPMLVHR